MRAPPDAERLSLIGVDYARVKTSDGGHLYLTRFGLPLREQLDPENWFAPEWFVQRRVRLEGTSTIYKVPTRPRRGASLDLVVRFSRVGQEIPLDLHFVSNNPQAEFNSPFEEFALLTELRAARLGGCPGRIFTKKPLAIYVPAARLREWQTGRLGSKMALKRARHPEASLEMSREYILLYGWVKGMNAVQAALALEMAGDSAASFLAETTLRVIHDLAQLGFRVLDMKPQHIVLRLRPDGSLLRDRDGNPAYALVDYELLERIENPAGSRQPATPDKSCAR